MVDKGEQRFEPDEKGNLPWHIWQQEEARKQKVKLDELQQETDRRTKESLESWWALRDRDVWDEYIGQAFVQLFEDWKRSRRA